MSFWHRFLRAATPLRQITLVDFGEQMGPHKIDWLAYQRRQQLGRAHLCHPANWITSPAQRERIERVAQAVNRITRTNNVRTLVRKKA
jgi:hypothetical protein